MNKRKAEAGVIVAMTIIGFISVGISLDAMINVANNAFGTGFTPTAGAQAGEFESTVESICDGDVGDSNTLRMSTTDADDFQIEFNPHNTEEINGEMAYVKYNHTEEDDINLRDQSGCGVVEEDSQSILNPGVTYTVEKKHDELVVVQ